MCHSDSDISICVTEANVFHTGDTWWNGHFFFLTLRSAAASMLIIRG